MIVCKFGGTSVAGNTAFKNIKNIVNENDNRKIIVVSALGKSKEHNYKITDKLFELYYLLKNGLDGEQVINEIFFRYEQMSNKMGVKINWQKYKEQLKEKISSKKYTKEYLVSRGEYYSAILYSKYLNANFLDAKNYIIFNKCGKIDEKTTKNRLKMLNFDKKYVIGGYYGANKEGEICVFDRGGSDITGAIITKLLTSEIYENYTDVEGVYNKNPNIFTGAKKMPLLSFKTAITLAECGNEVVHKDALIEMKKSNALLIVKSTNAPERLGTIITEDYTAQDLFICKSTVDVAEFAKLEREKIKKVKKYADLDKVLIANQKYIAIMKSVYLSNRLFTRRLGECNLVKCVKYTFFSNVKLDIKYYKKIKKIQNKLKNNCIFADFYAFFNNFVIICKTDDAKNTEKIINNILN